MWTTFHRPGILWMNNPGYYPEGIVYVSCLSIQMPPILAKCRFQTHLGVAFAEFNPCPRIRCGHTLDASTRDRRTRIAGARMSLRSLNRQGTHIIERCSVESIPQWEFSYGVDAASEMEELAPWWEYKLYQREWARLEKLVGKTKAEILAQGVTFSQRAVMVGLHPRTILTDDINEDLHEPVSALTEVQ